MKSAYSGKTIHSVICDIRYDGAVICIVRVYDGYELYAKRGFTHNIYDDEKCYIDSIPMGYDVREQISELMRRNIDNRDLPIKVRKILKEYEVVAERIDRPYWGNR